MSASLTKKQHEVLTFVENFINRNGYSPSYREIMEGLGLASPAPVAHHISILCAKGYLKKDPRSSRSLEVVRRGPSK